jgi:predicted transposase YbfD/YdcC
MIKSYWGDEMIMEKLKNVAEESEHNGYWYRMVDVVKALFLGLFCGQQTLQDIWCWASSPAASEVLRAHFEIRKLPCYSHFTNLVALINANELNKVFMEIFGELITNAKTIAIDGKTVCSTAKMKGRQAALHIASAYISESGITLGQLAVEDKKNEISAVQNLIKLIDVSGAMVVADALNCQKKTAKAVLDGGGDYLLAVKKNHRNLYDDIAEMIEYKQKDVFETRNAPLDKAAKIEKGHGRIEKRTAYVTDDILDLESCSKWAGLACIGMVKTNEETRYYISSRRLSAEELLYFSRNEWAVESMHWQLDVIFGEDRCCARDDNVQKTLNILRKTVLNLVRLYKLQTGSKLPMSRIMKNCSFDPVLLLDTLVDMNALGNVTNLLQN